MAQITPLALKDAPALIEATFPAQKVSFEAQQERTSVQSQTLTGLGSYWKGRKPLILVKSIILGSLLPKTGDSEKDLETYEMLMSFDAESLAKRAVTLGAVKPFDLLSTIEIHNPWDFFSHNIKENDDRFSDVDALKAPFDSHALGLNIRWRKDVDDDEKVPLFKKYLQRFETYEEKASLCKRPEECDPSWLSSHVWAKTNLYYSKYGISANSLEELVEQFGILRFGNKPSVGDVFSGGGSIPFEAARVGCNAFASDLNPVACMLTWGTTNIIGAGPEKRQIIDAAQKELVDLVEKEIEQLELEVDEEGNRAKAFLCCLETKCPEPGWLVSFSLAT